MSSAAARLRAILARKAAETEKPTSRTLADITAEWPHPVPMAPVGVRLVSHRGEPLLSKAWRTFNRKYKTVTDWCNAHAGEPIARVISAPLSTRTILRHLEWLDEYIDRAARQARQEGRTLLATQFHAILGPYLATVARLP